MGVAMVKKKSTCSDSCPSRRGFLSNLWIVVGGIALLQALAGVAGFFLSGRRQSRPQKADPIRAGSANDFPPGSVTLIRRAHCYLTRLDDGGFLAISRKCTHLGCSVSWNHERKQFECPCHGSVFNRTGNVIKSPAPRALDLYPIRLDRKTILIDVGKPITRAAFAAGQAIYFRKQD